MSRGAQLKVSSTRTIPKPNSYILAIYGEYAGLCFDEQVAPEMRGQWREKAFNAATETPLDLEIGTGTGTHFAQLALRQPQRLVLGMELKYKPLIQTIRRAVRGGAQNARVMRYNASLVHELFADEEINDVYIHFPDPWSKLRQHKHRLIQPEFLQRLYRAQKPGSRVEFKTDSLDYFNWSLEHFKNSPYEVVAETFDLHQSELAKENHVTQFENIFLRQGVKINYALLRKSKS